MNIRPEVLDFATEIIQLRRKIHQTPETSYQEHQTAALAKKILQDNNFVVIEHMGKTGLCGILDTGLPGPNIAFRAEMDALNITETTDFEFKSKVPGVMHACGHDLHLAMLLSLAKLLNQGILKKKFVGKIMLICQPAEEGGAGAKAMLEDGLFEKTFYPDYIFAAHIDPTIDFGTIILNKSAIMAGTMDFKIDVKGRGGHAAMPHQALNPLPYLAEIISKVDCFTPPKEALVTISNVHAGERSNIIPQMGILSGTLRYHNIQAKNEVINFMEDLTLKISQKNKGIHINIRWHEGYPPVINSSQAASLVEKAILNVSKNTIKIKEAKPAFTGEDFAYFLEKINGAFFFIGASQEQGINYPLHSSDFNPNEKVLVLGVEIWLQLIELISGKD